jgi:pyruvate kinase
MCTVGPASEQLPMLKKVVSAGMRIMRINFSHATYEEADLRMKNLNLSPGVNQSSGKAEFNLRAVMLDTQGPEIRTGMFVEGVKEVTLVSGEEVTLTTDEAKRTSQSKETIWISYLKLPNTVKPGDSILLDGSLIINHS